MYWDRLIAELAEVEIWGIDFCGLARKTGCFTRGGPSRTVIAPRLDNSLALAVLNPAGTGQSEETKT